MVVRFRLPAHTISPSAYLPSGTRISLVSASSAVLLGVAIVVGLDLTSPHTPEQPAPAVATPWAAAPPVIETSTSPSAPQIPMLNVSSDGQLGMAAEFLPARVRAGAPLVMRFTIQNRSAAPLGRVRIDASGPWDDYTVAEITPAGSFERVSDSQAIVRSQLNLAASSTAAVSLLAFASQPGEAQFTFDLRPPESE